MEIDPMKRKPYSYTVVEMAGYQGEKNLANFDTYERAARWLNRNYSSEEASQLHIAIAKDSDRGRTYDI